MTTKDNGTGKKDRKINLGNMKVSHDALGKAGNLEVRNALAKYLSEKHRVKCKTTRSADMVPILESVYGQPPKDSTFEELEYKYVWLAFQAIIEGFEPPELALDNWMKQSKPQIVLNYINKNSQDDDND